MTATVLDSVQNTVKGLVGELPGLIAVSVVDVESGMSLGSHSNQPDFDPDVASAYNAEVIKQKQRAMAALNIDKSSLDDILISLAEQIHVLKIAPSGQHFVYVAASAKNSSLAIIRSVLRKYMSSTGAGL